MGVDLSVAIIIDANLSGAILIGAILNGDNLTDAILTGANLTSVSLPGFDLSDTNFLNSPIMYLVLISSIFFIILVFIFYIKNI